MSRLILPGRRWAVGTSMLWASLIHGHEPAQAQAVVSAPSGYRTPYRVAFKAPLQELVLDLEQSERGDPRLESEVPFAHWYSKRTLERWHSWGPPARIYPPPMNFHRWPLEMKRERVIAVALRFLGYDYQHHHVPDWDPPAHWPWKATRSGHNGKGVDCSNFTGFVYNMGCGLKLNGDVHRQAEERFAEGPGPDRRTPIRRIALPESHPERVTTLRTGDLLFIRGKPEGEITHVVLWVGPIGESRDGAPLIIDSHGEGVRDSEERPIPPGIQLRPFHAKSWYNRCASHALRLFNEPEG